MMKWFDLHCDHLNKQYLNKLLPISRETNLDIDYLKIVKSNVRVQSFAIYVSRSIQFNRMNHIKKQVACFKTLLKQWGFLHVREKEDLQPTVIHEKCFGGLLTLEGVGDLINPFEDIEVLYEDGLRALSLTWNESNWAADGALGNKNGGITRIGKKFVEKCEQLGIGMDASHLSEQSFWDLLAVSSVPIYCSHSNLSHIHDHPRNLTNKQVKAIISQQGLIGITFVPAFLNSSDVSNIDDVIKNINQICELGGAKQVSFGSDFDGIDQYVIGLEDCGKLYRLYDQLSKHFSLKEVNQFTWENAYNYFTRIFSR